MAFMDFFKESKLLRPYILRSYRKFVVLRPQILSHIVLLCIGYCGWIGLGWGHLLGAGKC